MSTDLIRYDLLVQDAMREVLRKVLSDVAEAGCLPGEHHFTISFLTRAPGVRISKRLAEQWPQEMTIILQHQFSNLTVDERGFSVGLSFRSIPEQLYIRFDAVTGFFDPSVEFGLKFEILDGEDETEKSESSSVTQSQAPAEPKAEPRQKPSLARSSPPLAEVEPAEAESKPGKEEPAKVVSIDAFRKKT
jgi:hypothetical protein